MLRTRSNSKFPKVATNAEFLSQFTKVVAQTASVVGVMSFIACTPNKTSSGRAGIDPQAAVSAAPNVRDSLGSASAASALPSGLSPGNQDQMIIQKSALDKEFLFSGSSIPQVQAATSTGMVGRVVMFRRQGSNIFMLESTQGQVVSPTLPSTLILASFPILSETTAALVIDFNKGMSQVFNDSAMYASDETGFGYQPTMDGEAIRASFLESVKVVGNTLEIRQAAQVPEPAPLPSGTPDGTPAGTTFTSYEFRYYLEPYHPNQNFKPLEVKPTDFEHVGFFETNPMTESVTGRSITRAAMRDLSKPVVYAISSNTPAQFHDSVRDGILYWNKVFGREVVQAIDAPADVTAPDPQYNIIQWVENDSAGFAYADVLLDPRSGEILHSQVYLTSVFGTGSLHEIPQVVRQYEPAPTAKFQKGLFSSTRVCDRGVDPDAASAMTEVKSQAAIDPAVYSRVVNNYVQFVVTHEVGHTLGLRHNFAGSLASTATPDATDKMFSDYLLKGNIPTKGQIFASSVMDYNSLSEDVLHVSMFNSQNLVLPYDQMAINWAYSGKTIDTSTAPPFCTDTQNGVIADCLTFDRGAKPIVANEQAINKALRLAGYSLAEQYIAAKAPADPRDVMAFSDVPIDPDAAVKTLVTSLKSQIGWLKSGGNQSIAIMNQFPFLNDFYKSDIVSAEDASVAEQVEEAGGVNNVLLPLMIGKINPAQSLSATASAALATYLQRDDVKNGLGAAGQSYTLSDSEIALIKSNGQKFFKEAEDRAFDQSLLALASGTYTNKKLAPDVEKMLGALTQKILFAHGDQTVATLVPVAVPTPVASASPAPQASSTSSSAATQPAYVFSFTQAERLAATQLLNKSLGGNNSEWSVDARKAILGEYVGYLAAVLGQDPTKVDATTLSEPLRGWFTDQVGVVNLISASSDK